MVNHMTDSISKPKGIPFAAYLSSALAILALGSIVLYFWVKGDGGSSQACEKAAGIDQAHALLSVHFPKLAINTAELLDLGAGAKAAGCLLEVDMHAVKGDDSSRGFVYLLPDGQRFLNGPLHDRRSKIQVRTGGANADGELETVLATNNAAINMINERLALLGAAPAGSPAPSTPATQEPSASPEADQKSVTAAREDLLAKLVALPSIRSPEGSPDKAVYVLVDPVCVNCAKLSAQSEELTKRFGIQWNWLPMYTSERGWVLSALALREYGLDPKRGNDVLHETMKPTWDVSKHAESIEALSEADYVRAKENFMTYHSLADKNPSLGTPVVVFRRKDGTVEVISGLPNADDWQAIN